MIVYLVYLLSPNYAKRIILKSLKRALEELGEELIGIDERNIKIKRRKRYRYSGFIANRGNLIIVVDLRVLKNSYIINSLTRHEAVHFYILNRYGVLTDMMINLGIEGSFSEAPAYLYELKIQLENGKGDKLDTLMRRIYNYILKYRSINYLEAIKEAKRIIKEEREYLLMDRRYRKPIINTLSEYIYYSLGRGKNKIIRRIMAKSIMDIFYKNVDK